MCQPRGVLNIKDSCSHHSCVAVYKQYLPYTIPHVATRKEKHGFWHKTEL